MKFESEVTQIFDETCLKYNPEEMTLGMARTMVDDIFYKLCVYVRKKINCETPVPDNIISTYSLIHKVDVIMSHFSSHFCHSDFVAMYGNIVRDAVLDEAKKKGQEFSKTKFNDVKYIDENNDFYSVYGKGLKLRRIALAKKYIGYLENLYDELEDGEVYELKTTMLIKDKIVGSKEKRWQDLKKLIDMGLIYKVIDDVPYFLCQQFIVNVKKAEEIRSLTDYPAT